MNGSHHRCGSHHQYGTVKDGKHLVPLQLYSSSVQLVLTLKLPQDTIMCTAEVHG